MSLVEITAEKYDVELDIAYATQNNLTGKPMYKKAKGYLHPSAEKLLVKAIKLAKGQGLKLKIFDAYRPLEVQQQMWDFNPDDNFISNPKTGSIPHCRGVAVDLTLIDKDGKELEMGTEFDNFTPLAHHGNMQISKQAQQNRFLLMGIMTTAGWDFYRNEWWHYQMFNAREYTALSNKHSGVGLLD